MEGEEEEKKETVSELRSRSSDNGDKQMCWLTEQMRWKLTDSEERWIFGY